MHGGLFEILCTGKLVKLYLFSELYGGVPLRGDRFSVTATSLPPGICCLTSRIFDDGGRQ
jgi:hypothetical protein